MISSSKNLPSMTSNSNMNLSQHWNLLTLIITFNSIQCLVRLLLYYYYKPSNPCPTNDTFSAAHQPPAVSLLHVSGPCNAVRKAVGRKASGKVATLAVTEGTWRDSVVNAKKNLDEDRTYVETGSNLCWTVVSCACCKMPSWPGLHQERRGNLLAARLVSWSCKLLAFKKMQPMRVVVICIHDFF